MKYLYTILFVAFVGLTSCKKECEVTHTVCNETVPVGELCQAAFKRWFYDKTSDSCTEISYSGCSQKGFATQEACEECKCN